MDTDFFYYSDSTGGVYTPSQMLSLFGINTNSTSLDILNSQGFYLVQQATNLANNLLYSTILTYSVSPPYAYEVWTPVPRDLPIAKENGKTLVNQNATGELDILYNSTNTSVEVLCAVASQPLASRPVVYQTVIDSTVAITNAAALKIDAIDSATTVDEINNIVNPPTGTLFTGRGAGEAPLDLNVSYYTLFNSVSMTEADTELYVPGTSTVIPYGSYPGGFDSIGDCFTLGNYLLQIRETATGSVIAEFECPLAPAGENVSF